MRATGMRDRGPWLVAGAFLALLLAAALREQPATRMLAALDAREVSALCAAEGYPRSNFWERVKAMGVGAAVVHVETIGDLAERGQILVFSRPELEKWKSLGLITPAASLKPNILWIRDPKVFLRVTESLREQGLVASTGAAAGHGLVALTRDPAPAIEAGVDPAEFDETVSLGLIAAVSDGAGKARMIGPSAAEHGPVGTRCLNATAGLAPLLRAIYSQPGRLITLRLDAGRGVEGNLSDLRGLLRPLRQRELVGAVWPHADAAGGRAARWRWWAAWILAVVGPIAAVRVGVKGFKKVRRAVLEQRPVASPVAELVAGMSAVTLASVAVGLAVGLILSGTAAAQVPESLAFSAMAWPLAIGAAALYPISARTLGRKLRRSPAYSDILGFAALALAAVLLFRPRLLLSGTPVWGWTQAGADFSTALWWWPWRWREFLVGFPALLQALDLVGRRLDAPDNRIRYGWRNDPRPWLWLGLLFPIGTIASLGRPGAPLWSVLGQTVVVFVVGLALGGLLLILRAVSAKDRDGSSPREAGLSPFGTGSQDKGPTPHRTIDLDQKL
ncbi:MAG TPA: hypothetical protein DEB40_01855 [Elusimicrobia bacterium]|nr:hypothetical protein [Elusimicrobiota bacterium]HBT60474.1 hypothetical protein [Elusimicrobiota bacterium]